MSEADKPVHHDDVSIEEVEIEEEEEIEVTDDEDDVEPEVESSPPPPAPIPSKKGKAPATPSKAAAAQKKVQPSPAVKNLRMESPESSKRAPGSSLSTTKNPFPSYGGWTKEELSQIDIVFPILTGKNESTNELTRSSRPEARYWKAPIVFKFSTFSSDTLRIDNVHLPFHTGKGYGSNYVYMCLPGYIGAEFAAAGKKIGPTRVTENSLLPDDARWWKIANKVENSFGVINQETKRFHVKSLETIFDATSSGISCSVVLKFTCKASTTELEPLKPTTVRTVAAEVVRAYITQVDINVQGPARVSKDKPRAEPVASSKDVATDALLKRLGDLGL